MFSVTLLCFPTRRLPATQYQGDTNHWWYLTKQILQHNICLVQLCAVKHHAHITLVHIATFNTPRRPFSVSDRNSNCWLITASTALLQVTHFFDKTHSQQISFMISMSPSTCVGGAHEERCPPLQCDLKTVIHVNYVRIIPSYTDWGSLSFQNRR